MASRGICNPSVALSLLCCMFSSSSLSASGCSRCSAPTAGPNSSCFYFWYGPAPVAQLVLFLIVAPVAAQGSRLSAVRWATQHAVAETLGLQPFDEDDL